MLNEFLLIFLLLTGLFCWYRFHQVWEMALAATKARCHRADVQMLDDYVAIKSIRLTRGTEGNRQFRYTFGFEFTATGQDRYHGQIVFLGQRMESFFMEPHRINTSSTATVDHL